MAKQRSYLTLSEAIDFASWTHSDERRKRLQDEAAEKLEKNIQNFTPWTTAMRFVDKEDLRLWRESQLPDIISEIDEVIGDGSSFSGPEVAELIKEIIQNRK